MTHGEVKAIIDILSLANPVTYLVPSAHVPHLASPCFPFA